LIASVKCLRSGLHMPSLNARSWHIMTRIVFVRPLTFRKLTSTIQPPQKSSAGDVAVPRALRLTFHDRHTAVSTVCSAPFDLR